MICPHRRDHSPLTEASPWNFCTTLHDLFLKLHHEHLHDLFRGAPLGDQLKKKSKDLLRDFEQGHTDLLLPGALEDARLWKVDDPVKDLLHASAPVCLREALR